jgi:membrane protein DedA with SNARE-associated domain
MLPAIDQLVIHYGGAAILLGAALEGEAAVTAGGYLARRHLVDPTTAAFCAWAGSFVMDQLVFWLGRFQRERKFVQRARLTANFGRAMRFIESHPSVFCIVFRFIYGLRIAGPLAIGISAIPARLYLVLNAISAALWASIFTFVGYKFGPMFFSVVSTAFSRAHGLVAVAGLAFALIALTVWRRRNVR